MERINLVELLKDCPSGMELDCTMYDNLHFDKVDDYDKKIHCYIQYKDHRTHIMFGKDGTYNSEKASKCVIFPKGKTTWEGFQRPFKDGDIVFYNDTIAIFKEWGDETLFRAHAYTYLGLGYEEYLCKEKPVFGKGIRKEVRFALEEEKQKLFQAIKDNGYKWNSETKVLGKLPKFKVGDRIILKDNPHNIPSIRIKAVTKCQYILENEGFFYIDSADEKYVLEDKFNINTLVPFESRVLVRNRHDSVWAPAFWGYYSKEYARSFVVAGGNTFEQCIPYEGNEHLLNSNKDCDECYKTWRD